MPLSVDRSSDDVALLENLPDEELFARFSESDDREAFDVLERKYGGQMLRMAIRYTQKSGIAPDDIVQMTWLKIIRRKSTYESARAPFKYWLFSVLRNAALDTRRRQKYRRACSLHFLQVPHNDDGSLPEREPADSVDVVGDATRHEFWRVMDEECAGLSPGNAQFLRLRYFQHMEPKELIREGIARDNQHVVRLTKAALKQLRTILEEHHLGYDDLAG